MSASDRGPPPSRRPGDGGTDGWADAERRVAHPLPASPEALAAQALGVDDLGSALLRRAGEAAFDRHDRHDRVAHEVVRGLLRVVDRSDQKATLRRTRCVDQLGTAPARRFGHGCERAAVLLLCATGPEVCQQVRHASLPVSCRDRLYSANDARTGLNAQAEY